MSDKEPEMGHIAGWGQIAVFIAVFVSLFTMANYYIFMHLSEIVPMPSGILWWAVVIFFSLLYMIGLGITARYHNLWVIGLNIAGSMWFSFMLLAVLALGIYDIINLFHNFYSPESRIALFLIVICIIIVGVANTFRITITRTRIKARGLKKPVTLALISDLHIGPIHTPKYLHRVVRMVNRQRPDHVVIPGDLADGPYRYDEKSFRALKKLKAPAYFVTGNHEHIGDVGATTKLIEGAGIKVLRNESVIANGIQIVGIDDAWGGARPTEMLRQANPQKDIYTILLSHQPQVFPAAAKQGIDLTLAGHIHGGQFFPFTLIYRLVVRYYKGLYRHGQSYCYVTQGTGTWGPPLRLGSNNEIAVLRLVPDV